MSESKNETWIQLTDEQIDLLPVDGSVLVCQKRDGWTVQGYLIATHRTMLWVAPMIDGIIREMRKVDISRDFIYAMVKDVPTDTVESRLERVIKAYQDANVDITSAKLLLADLRAAGLEIVRKETR